MNLPDLLNSNLLNNLRREMGNAPLVAPLAADIFPDRTTSQELKRIQEVGLDVDINRKVTFDGKNGTALYKDRRVLLYIRDWSNPNHDPRFHLANCNTIQEFRTGKAFGKFVAFEPENKENALFEVIYMHDSNRRERMALKVCKNCLDYLGYKGYESQRGAFTTNNEIFEKFSIAEYFSIYPPNCFIQNPLHNAQNAPLNDYTPDWNKISNDYRASKGYICEKCNIRLNDDRYRKYLHVHHENGLKYDNRLENLAALCICCHAERRRHEHLRQKIDYIDFVHMRGQIKAGI